MDRTPSPSGGPKVGNAFFLKLLHLTFSLQCRRDRIEAAQVEVTRLEARISVGLACATQGCTVTVISFVSVSTFVHTTTIAFSCFLHPSLYTYSCIHALRAA